MSVPAALGTDGGNLGYDGIPESVAIKFDLSQQLRRGSRMNGIYTDGAFPGEAFDQFDRQWDQPA